MREAWFYCLVTKLDININVLPWFLSASSFLTDVPRGIVMVIKISSHKLLEVKLAKYLEKTRVLLWTMYPSCPLLSQTCLFSEVSRQRLFLSSAVIIVHFLQARLQYMFLTEQRVVRENQRWNINIDLIPFLPWKNIFTLKYLGCWVLQIRKMNPENTPLYEKHTSASSKARLSC
jgi:uncharacterized membrane protein